MKAYKLFRKKRSNGALTPLFINKKKELPFGQWMEAEDHPTKGFAHRPKWHITFLPIAPHLLLKKSDGEVRVWAEVEVQDVSTIERPESQGGTWGLANNLLIKRELSDDEVEEILKENNINLKTNKNGKLV